MAVGKAPGGGAKGGKGGKGKSVGKAGGGDGGEPKPLSEGVCKASTP